MSANKKSKTNMTVVGNETELIKEAFTCKSKIAWNLKLVDVSSIK